MAGETIVVRQGLRGLKGEPGADGAPGADGPPGPALTPKGTVATTGDLPASGNTLGDLYTVSGTGHAYGWDGTTWVDLGAFAGSGGLANPMTTAGDMIVGGSGGAAIRLATANGQFAVNEGGALVARDLNAQVAATAAVTAVTPGTWGDHIEGGASAPGTVRGLEINVLHPDIGADPTGGVSSIAAINAARTRVMTSGTHQRTITYPAGTYLLDSSPSAINGASDLTIRGAGRNATLLAVNTAGVNVFNLQNFSRITIEDLTIVNLTGSPLASGVGVAASGTSGAHADGLRMHRVRIQNIPTPISLQYVDQLILDDVQVCQTVAGAVSGVGVLVDTCVSIRLRDIQNIITAGTFGNDCIRITNDCDTVILDGCEVGTAIGYGINIMNSTGATGPRLVRVLKCYSESNTSSGFNVGAGRDIKLIGCESAVNGGDGYDVSGGAGVTISECTALQNNVFGFWLGGGSGLGLFNSTATNNSQASNAAYDGIMVDAGVQHARVLGNRSGDFIFTLTNKQRYGLTIAATTDYIIAQGNDTVGNNTGGVNNASTGTHNSVTGNI